MNDIHLSINMELLPPEMIMNIADSLDSLSKIHFKRTCKHTANSVNITLHCSVPMKYYSVMHICHEFTNDAAPDEQIYDNIMIRRRENDIDPIAIEMICRQNKLKSIEYETYEVIISDRVYEIYKIIFNDTINFFIHKSYNYLHERIIRFEYDQSNVYVSQMLYPCDHLQTDISINYREMLTLDDLHNHLNWKNQKLIRK